MMAKLGKVEYGVLHLNQGDDTEHITADPHWSKDHAIDVGVAIQMMPFTTHVQLIERQWVKSK